MGRRKTEEQYQMSDNFVKYIIKYLRQNNLSFKDFCKLNDLSYYFTYKILDRKIKMHSYYSYLLLLAKKTGYNYFNLPIFIKKID